MAIFYHVVEGDPLDNGTHSEVIEGLGGCTIEGFDGRSRNQAFIGHRAYCGVCESAGLIAEGPGTPDYDLRMYDATIRAHEAVEGDIVLCECSPPPRIVAVYGRSSSIQDIGGSAARAPATAITRHSNQANQAKYSRWFLLRDSTTDEPLANQAFIADVGGSMQRGQTDSTGYAHVAADEAMPVSIHAMFSAPKRPLNPNQEHGYD
ncbi:PAAR domain-containing protein [Rhodanobacter sp. MP7CTX1]|uniref:PAAR domain-containing protein n=1 Tax=Rhodanobacter sp. MP7CTX1 TaxID=2723084 RepID=UPI0016088DAE|nr:PAAR domain-containing protein [Rhodanobacter sp. MP7CTX1]MBB6186428.1 hypothetical protein [Rhodanobacter sp. MP7CTX1]